MLIPKHHVLSHLRLIDNDHLLAIESLLNKHRSFPIVILSCLIIINFDLKLLDPQVKYISVLKKHPIVFRPLHHPRLILFWHPSESEPHFVLI